MSAGVPLIQKVLLVLIERRCVTIDGIAAALGVERLQAQHAVFWVARRGLARAVDSESAGVGRRRKVYGPTATTAGALTIERVEGDGGANAFRVTERRRSSSGSGVIAGKKLIRGYVFPGGWRR